LTRQITSSPHIANHVNTSTSTSSPARTSTHILSSEKQLLHYLHQPPFPARKRTQFPLEHIEAGKTLILRTDLESVGVDVCNMEVPALFVENFDYRSMRPDFINGVLISDLLGKSIQCTIVGEGNEIGTISPRAQAWAALVGDVASYASVR
jgi:translation initiation factor eIF-2B subunit epsilon